MKTTYLLPCSCGEKTQVDASESGRTVHCRCGASLVVPTLRGLARLEKVEVEEPTSVTRAWGGVQRGIAIGALITLVGLGMSIYWTFKPAPTPQDVFTPKELAERGIPADYKPGTKHDLSPAETRHWWTVVASEGLMAPPAQKMEPYHRALDVAVWWRMLSYVVAGVGVIALGAALAVYWIGRSKQQAPRSAGAPAPA
jgi:hypothetical protein